MPLLLLLMMIMMMVVGRRIDENVKALMGLRNHRAAVCCNRNCMNFAARRLYLNLLPICVTRESNLISLSLGLSPSSSIGLLAGVNEAMLLKCLAQYLA